MSSPQAPRARIGKYELLEVLGKGAMGVVYRTLDPFILRPVALKTIRRDLFSPDEVADFTLRFRIEAQAAGALQHPGIVSVYEYGEEGDTAYIAMEFVEGHTLRQYMDRKVRFGIQDAVSVLTQLLDALQYAHDHHVWHRDIKPGNIMVVSNGRIKLTDFGVARVQSSNLTQSGAVFGTPGFIAPEFYAGDACDHRVDLFAAGVILYQLLAGDAPFQGNPDQILYKVCFDDPAALATAGGDPGLSRYEAVMRRALAKKPADRFGSATEFRDALLAAHADPARASISEETLTNVPPLPASAGGRESARSHAGGPPSTRSGFSTNSLSIPSVSELQSRGWNPEILARVEKHLSRFIGPVSRVVVRRAAGSTQDEKGLVRWIADNVIAAVDRGAFLALEPAGGSTLPQRPAASVLEEATVVPAAPQGSPTESDLQRATLLLTRHLGPIAQVLVRRAARPGVTRDVFLDELAEKITVPEQRASFLAEFGRKPRPGGDSMERSAA